MAPKFKKLSSNKKLGKLPQPPLLGKKEEKKIPLTAKSILKRSTPRRFQIGGDILPKRDLTRFVKWPKYIQIQRKRKILLQRLKIPPMINQFSNTLNKNQAGHLIKFLEGYRPESKPEKKARLLSIATAKVSGKDVVVKKPYSIISGINEVTKMVEQKKTKLVVIANDVVPIELVVWLPTLCRKKDIAYCIIKGRARLGQLVGKKKCTAVCMGAIKKEDRTSLDSLISSYKLQFNDNLEARRKWGGGIMGPKANDVLEKKDKALAIEQAKKIELGA